MSDLTDFLLARIAEDEAEARAELPNIVDSDFLLKWRPGRVLAECEAKRSIIDTAYASREAADFVGVPLVIGLANGMDVAVSMLALPYADHPDYREEWRP